jgi:general secretion pathway protein B
MSFILDALKKSDAERQKRSTPGFADIPVSRDRRQPPRWLWIVGGLLAVNLAVLVVLLVRPDTAPATPGEGPADEQAAGPAARDAARPFADIVAEARQKAEQASTAAPQREPRQEPAASARSGAASDGQRTAGTGVASVANQRANDARASETANTFESLRADGTLSLPDLHLDIHVYSEQPAERFVFINTKKYREKETLTEGPTIRQIAPEGVILEHRGTAFLLPRE